MSIFLNIKKRLYLIGIFIAIVFLSSFMVNPMATSQRINLWKEALMIIKDSPIFGTGLNTYTIVAPKYALTAETGIYAHNCYLQMAAEIGVIGLFSFPLILLLFYFHGIRSLNNKNIPKTYSWYMLLGSLAAILGYCVHMAVDTSFYSLDLGMLFWIVLGLGIAAMNNVKLETVTPK